MGVFIFVFLVHFILTIFQCSVGKHNNTINQKHTIHTQNTLHATQYTIKPEIQNMRTYTDIIRALLLMEEKNRQKDIGAFACSQGHVAGVGAVVFVWFCDVWLFCDCPVGAFVCCDCPVGAVVWLWLPCGVGAVVWLCDVGAVVLCFCCCFCWFGFCAANKLEADRSESSHEPCLQLSALAARATTSALLLILVCDGAAAAPVYSGSSNCGPNTGLGLESVIG